MGAQRFVTRVIEVDETKRWWQDIVVSGPFRGSTGSWSIISSGAGSRVRLEVLMDAPWPLKIILPFIRRSAARDLDAEFANLKALIESLPAKP
jgi:ribosome-associated toxin RatA of RatAB toxin-antitoxin module